VFCAVFSERGNVAAIRDVLIKTTLFKGLSDAELEQVLPLCREQSHSAGFSVLAEGTAAKDLFIVAEGRVMVEMNLSAYSGMIQDAMIETIPAGEPFGWSAVVGSRVYTMTARCLEATKVIAIDGEKLLLLFNDNPSIGFKVMEGLVEVINARLKGVIKAALA
jgi:CRP-like cAMP-binding protein